METKNVNSIRRIHPSLIASIIVPTFNKANQLASTLERMLRQDLDEALYEVVVVDNNSSDDTKAVLDRLAEKYRNLRYITETKKGPSAARNRGISESRGNLLIFTDDDMHIMANHIRRHREFHENFEQPLCVVGRWRDRTCYDSRVLGLYNKHHMQIIPSNNDIVHPGLSLAAGNFSLFRSTLELIKDSRDGETYYFDERLLVLEDGDFGYRLESVGVKFCYTKEILVEHHHCYTKHQIVNRAYQAGYYQYLFELKHPYLSEIRKIIIVRSPIINALLWISGFFVFMLGYLVQWISPWVMLKGVGAWLLYNASKGYQKATQDFATGNTIPAVAIHES